MSLYPNEGIYRPSSKDINRLKFSGAMLDLSNLFAGRPVEGLVQSMPQQAVDQYKQDALTQHEMRLQEQAMSRQSEIDALNARNIESQIAARTHGMSGESGVDPIGSPQKLANGNIGVVVADPNSPNGVSVVDTGNAYKTEPSLEQQLAHFMAKQDYEQRPKHADEISKADDAYIAGQAAIAGLNKAQSLLDDGLSTGTITDIYTPQFMKSPDAQEFMSIVNEQVLAEAEKMTGVLSESDMKFLKESTISLNNKPEANLRILTRKMDIIKRGMSEAKRKGQHFQGGGTFFDYKPSWELEDEPPKPSNLREKYNLNGS